MLITKYKSIEIRPWSVDELEFKGTFFYGMCYWLDAPRPYFVIDDKTFVRKKGGTRWYPHTIGDSYSLILTRAPMLSELLTFDFWGQDGLRVNYSEWLSYLYKSYRDWQEPEFGQTSVTTSQARQNYRNQFRKVVLLASGEKIPFIKGKDDLNQLHIWLEARKPFLQKCFHQIMQKFEIEYITEEEMRAFNQKKDFRIE